MEAVSKQKNMNGKTEGMVQTKSMGKADTKMTGNAQAGSSVASEGMEEKSLFKKWWFWVAVSAGIIILAFVVWFFLF